MIDLLVSHGVPKTKAEIMNEYALFLLKTNVTMNLTSITGLKEIAEKHFIDSLSANLFIPNGANVIDVGTGAGFPGIPLAILRDDIQVTLLDSTAKKINFIRETTKAIGIKCNLIVGRAEEVSWVKEYRESFDVIVSRATAFLPVLLEMVSGLSKVGGNILCYKSSSKEEILEAENAQNTLNLGLEKVHTYTLLDQERQILVYKKLSSSPKYPRKYAQMKSHHL